MRSRWILEARGIPRDIKKKKNRRSESLNRFSRMNVGRIREIGEIEPGEGKRENREKGIREIRGKGIRLAFSLFPRASGKSESEK